MIDVIIIIYLLSLIIGIIGNFFNILFSNTNKKHTYTYKGADYKYKTNHQNPFVSSMVSSESCIMDNPGSIKASYNELEINKTPDDIDIEHDCNVICQAEEELEYQNMIEREELLNADLYTSSELYNE